MNGSVAAGRSRFISKYAGILRVSLQTALAYRANVLSGFLFYTMYIVVFFNLWRAIYAGGGVEGLSFRQMIWYLCITELIGFGTRVNLDIANQVKTGEIAYQLLRPYSYIGFRFASVAGEMLYRLFTYGLLALALGFLTVGPIDGFRPWTLAPSLMSVFLGIGIHFMSMTAIGLAAFRIEETVGLYLVYQKLVFMLGMFIPVEFLPDWLASIARNLPFSYVTWAPARLVVGFTWELFLQVIAAQLFWFAVISCIAVLQYRSGIKSVQSQGG
jgi:ABC-2 type transport system permease protein